MMLITTRGAQDLRLGRHHVPSTIPPFHTTNPPNSASEKTYGMNIGNMSGSIDGALRTDRTRSTEDDWPVGPQFLEQK